MMFTVIFQNLQAWNMFMLNTHKQYLYSKECPKGRIFEKDEDVTGWVDSPTKINTPVVKKKRVVKKKLVK